ncbi:uncharacterized protein AKAW2_40097A [Aspergillus luchuensis]|uniref:Uncharacterized protein n=1 Tax=Aspergillus kawachii TaxID=1069201 RepID=A0A7R7W8T2_ASPKA|nr:uncharacterized protein AKAW2_40097A [Aspergillus luchuensis]BCR98414.1 hypothetical protein AKAW2_40097A [Aspergillus luchuensis]
MIQQGLQRPVPRGEALWWGPIRRCFRSSFPSGESGPRNSAASFTNEVISPWRRVPSIFFLNVHGIQSSLLQHWDVFVAIYVATRASNPSQSVERSASGRE